jgi:hypothetical protein
MAQADQQVQNEELTVPNVHFRWLGSNAPIASLKASDPLFYDGGKNDDLASLRDWLVPKLGLQPKYWYQVTLYFGNRRLTHDVLLGAHLHFIYRKISYLHSLMPHIGEANESFVMQLKTTTTNMVVHVTCCSDADCEAAELLRCSCLDVWDDYCNNVAYIINAVTRFDDALGSASLKMQQNELVALAALDANVSNAQFVSPALWDKPSFVLKAAALRLDFSTYLGPAVRGNAATMLSLIKTKAKYFDAATLNTDFEFQCLAVSANPGVLCKLDTLTQTKVAERSCNLSAAAAADS